MAIKVLDAKTISLIAAGEVVENPSSVVKELIENSIDAFADNIKIEIEKAGRKLIRVYDNGCGMNKDDLSLSVFPHATSKIKKFEDINEILSYGFRGEALYSIFSVSKILINTYDGKGDSGYSLSACGGDMENIVIKPAPAIKGTIIEITDLFYNTPARKKFLKSDNSLKAAIIRVVEDFALSWPTISFELKIDGKEIFSLVKADDYKNMNERIKKILMPKTAENMIYFENKRDEYKLFGYISNPSNLISTRTSQYYFVNKRAVESKVIQQGLYKAYEHIRNGKHPACILFLEASPSSLDVNVHPQKKEIRFKDESFIYDFIYSSISNAINKSQIPVRLQVSDDYSRPREENKEENLIFKDSSSNISHYVKQDFLDHIYKDNESPNWYNPPINFIGQAFSSFLVFQSSDSILIVDQHAAVERIMFEKYLKEFADNMIQIQELLMPIQVEINPKQIENIMRWSEWLKSAGFEINRSGNENINVYAIPAVFDFNATGLSEFFIYLSEILGDPQKVQEDVKRKSIATLACKKSIKAKDKLDGRSALKIIEELKNCADSLHCPHGRPTIIQITLDDLIKKFGRSSI